MSSKKNGSRKRAAASNGLEKLLAGVKPPETTPPPPPPPPAVNVSTLPIPDTYRSILKGFKAEHAQFILNLCRPRNVSIGAAYAKAYPRCESQNAAYVGGSNLLKNPKISEAVEKIRGMIAERVAKRLEVTEERLVAEYAKIAYADAGDYGTWDGDTLILKSSDDLPPDLTAAISSVRRVETAEGVRVELKFHDKNGALDSLSRYRGLFKDKLDVKFTDLDTLMSAIDGKSRGLPGDQATPGG